MSHTILPRSAWTSTPNGRAGRTLRASEVTAITVHYPASGSTRHAGQSKATTAALLESWRRLHTRPPRSWADIGYNYAIDQAGRIWYLTGLNRGAHAGTATGNRTSVGVLMIVGNTETPTAAMLEAFRWLRSRILVTLPKATRVLPHSAWVKTGCPGDKLRDLIESGLILGPVTDPDTVVWFEQRFLNVKGDDTAGAASFSKRAETMVSDLTEGRPEAVAVCELRDDQARDLFTPLMRAAGYVKARQHAGNALYLVQGSTVTHKNTYWLPEKVQGAGRREALLRVRAKVAGHYVLFGVSHLDYRPGDHYDRLRVAQAKSIIAAMTRFAAPHGPTSKGRHSIALDENSPSWVRDQAFKPAGYAPAVKVGIDAIYTGKNRPVLSSRSITTRSDHPIVAAVFGKAAP